MKSPDLDRERCEQELSMIEFLAIYNEGLPLEFPRVSAELLQEFSNGHPELFKNGSVWSLNQHRKRVMDWLPGYMRFHKGSG